MAERIVSERVVSRRVVGSANPIAKKFRNLKGSFGGVCIAPIIILIALGVLYWGEKFQRSSKIVESLALESAEEVSADSGSHKMQGTPIVTTPAVAPQVGDTLYYYYKEEQYREVEETETETVTTIENGMEIEEEIERVKIVPKWVEVESKSGWAEYKLGNYTVKPSGADLELNLSSKEYREDLDTYYELTGSQSITPELGDYRIVVEYLPIESELLVIGDISGGAISGGDVFIISNKSDSELLSDLQTEETALYWVSKGGAWLMLTIGLLMILGPILSLLDFIPIAGKAANCAASIIAAVISIGIVLAATLIIKFWWLCLGLAVVGVVGLVVVLVLLIMKQGKGTDKKEEKPEASKEASKEEGK